MVVGSTAYSDTISSLQGKMVISFLGLTPSLVERAHLEVGSTPDCTETERGLKCGYCVKRVPSKINEYVVGGEQGILLIRAKADSIQIKYTFKLNLDDRVIDIIPLNSKLPNIMYLTDFKNNVIRNVRLVHQKNVC